MKNKRIKYYSVFFPEYKLLYTFFLLLYQYVLYVCSVSIFNIIILSKKCIEFFSDEALDMDECRRPRSESSTGAGDEANSTHIVGSSYLNRHYPQHRVVNYYYYYYYHYCYYYFFPFFFLLPFLLFLLISLTYNHEATGFTANVLHYYAILLCFSFSFRCNPTLGYRHL